MQRRVCVVGAGPGGLCVARRLAEQFGTQIELTILNNATKSVAFGCTRTTTGRMFIRQCTPGY
ncbi:hypothetical protein GPALN_014880, partial [Globodera pallida]